MKCFFLDFKMEREREEIGGERESISANQVVPHHPLAMGARGPHGSRECSRPWGPQPHQQPAYVAHGLGCPLARSLGSSARILGVRTSILNLFPDYKP